MNRLKVAIQELRDHLGRDTRGTLLLDKVTAIANDQRTRCASLEERLAAGDAIAKSLRSKLNACESEISAIKAELSSTRARLLASEARERAMVKSETHAEAESYEGGEGRTKKLLNLLGQVRKRFKHCPTNHQTSGGIVVEDLIKSFSFDEFAGLGMVMALCAFCGVPQRIRSETPVLIGQAFDENQQEKFFKWFFKSGNDFGTKTGERLFFAAELSARASRPSISHSPDAAVTKYGHE